MKLTTRNMRLLVAAAVLSGFTVTAQAAGDAAAGEGKAGLCGGCHGMDGNSEDATYPRLAGQYAGYIVKQVKDFQKGHRANNDTMAGMAAMVGSDQDAKDIGAFYSTQKMKGSLTKPNKELVAKGEKLFREGNAKSGVYGCINCHGDKGKGRAEGVSAFPVIGGQHRDYLIKQLTEFRDGQRANDPAGMMSGIAKKMTDAEIKAVAEYLAAQI